MPATTEQLERRIRALERDLQAARGIGTAAKMRSKLTMGGRQIEHLANPSSDADSQNKISSANTLDHGSALTGLGDDDHTQYALLAGRSGGQTAIGGTAANESLTLKSNTATLSDRMGVRLVSDGLDIYETTITWPTGKNPQFRAMLHQPTITGIDADNPNVGAIDLRPVYEYSVAQAWGWLSSKKSMAFEPTWKSTVGSASEHVGSLISFFLHPVWDTNENDVDFTYTFNGLTGLWCTPQLTSPGSESSSMGYLEGIRSTPREIEANHTVTDGIGVRIVTPTVNGTCTTWHGLYIQDGAGPTNNISIHQTGTASHNRIQGKTKFGADSAPNTTVQVDGDISYERTQQAFGAFWNGLLTGAGKSYIDIAGLTTSTNLKGISGGSDGKCFFVTNRSGVNLTVEHNETVKASNGERIFTADGSDQSTSGDGWMLLLYNDALDSGHGGWHLMYLTT